MEGKGDKKKDTANRICFVIVGVTAFVLFLFSLISFSSLTYLETNIISHTVYENETHGFCILYADFNESTNGSSYPLIRLGTSNVCGFAIYGEIILTVYALVFVFVPCIKAVCERGAKSCDLLVEISLHIISAMFAFLIGVVLSSGLRDTCNAVSQTQNGTCDELVIPEPGGEENSTTVAFFRHVKVSEVTAWFGWVMLMILIGCYSVWICMVCVWLKRDKKLREMRNKEQEERARGHEDSSKPV